MKKYNENADFIEYCKNFDIIAFYETWQVQPEEFGNFIDGYGTFESMRKKRRGMSRGSGGVSVFIKDWVLQTNGVVRIFQDFKESVVLLFKANIFHRTNDLIMIFTYIAPENSPIYTDEDNGIELLNERISEICVQYPTAELFLAGDLNARISTLQDFIPYDDLEFVFGDTDYPTDTFDIPRKSKDETYNRFGISLLDICCTYNIHVLNGRLFDDTNGEITCVANNGSSVVDYMLASTSLFDSFSEFKVGSDDFSDHFPLYCTISLPNINLQDSEPFDANANQNNWARFKWKENYKDEFMQLFSTLFTNFKEKISTENEPTSSYLSEFIDLIQKAGKCLKTKYNQTEKRKKQLPWWDKECETAKSYKYSFNTS